MLIVIKYIVLLIHSYLNLNICRLMFDTIMSYIWYIMIHLKYSAYKMKYIFVILKYGTILVLLDNDVPNLK